MHIKLQIKYFLIIKDEVNYKLKMSNKMLSAFKRDPNSYALLNPYILDSLKSKLLKLK